MRAAFQALSLTVLLLTGAAVAQTSQPDPDAAPPGAAARTPNGSGSPIIGLSVKSADNQKVGTIDNVIVGQDGRVQHLVVTVGGVLGVGAKQVIVSWNDLTIDRQRHEAVVAMSKEELKRSPEFSAKSAGPATQTMIPLPK